MQRKKPFARSWLICGPNTCSASAISSHFLRNVFATAHREAVKSGQRVINGMVLRLPGGIQLVPPHKVHRDGHLPLAIGAGHSHCSGAPDRAVMAPKRAMARDLHLVQAEAVLDLLPPKGDDGDSTLHLRQRRRIDDLACKQQAVKAIEIRNGRYERGRGTTQDMRKTLRSRAGPT